MKNLIVNGDLEKAALTMTSLSPNSNIILISGFPCCVNNVPPTETDGPPGAIAIAKCATALGLNVTLVTDECNELVFKEAIGDDMEKMIKLEIFPSEQNMKPDDYNRMKELVEHKCDLIIACERAGPGKDGNCYTMRGINMTEKGLIAPLHKIIDMAREIHGSERVKFVAIGDGGNEMGMGKVIENIRSHINNGDVIGAVTSADYLIAASVSNWGGYAFVGACAVVKNDISGKDGANDRNIDWTEKCLPSEQHEIQLLERCVSVGCRDGVSGEMEATVDGMPLSTSLNCLFRIRNATI